MQSQLCHETKQKMPELFGKMVKRDTCFEIKFLFIFAATVHNLSLQIVSFYIKKNVILILIRINVPA